MKTKKPVKTPLIVNLALFALFLYILLFPFKAIGAHSNNTKVSLYSKAQTGEYYTLYKEGIKKEDAFIGGFQFTKLDPTKENIYFYDPVLKVLAKINIKDGKVYKVIGKPKSTSNVDFSGLVKFDEVNLSKLIDFTLDNKGFIYLLIQNGIYAGDNFFPGDPRLLKASLNEGTIQEVVNFENSFKPKSPYYQSDPASFRFNLNGLTFDKEKSIFLYGTVIYKNQWLGGKQVSQAVVLGFDTEENQAQFLAGGGGFGFAQKLNINNDERVSIKGITFGLNKTIYLHEYLYGGNWQNAPKYYFTEKLVLNTDGKSYKREQFIEGENQDPNDIGDGGLAITASVGLIGSTCLYEDSNGDIYLSDFQNKRIRKVFGNSGFITTVAGGGNSAISPGEHKDLRSIPLENPVSILVDSFNNLYVIDGGRVLLISDLINNFLSSNEKLKIAKLTIVKIADREIKNPKGLIESPDVALDYTYAGEQTVEVKGDYIPDGTKIKLLFVNPDGSTDSKNTKSSKLTGGTALIPVKVEAGTTKIIKAETDPFIPAPGVQLFNE